MTIPLVLIHGYSDTSKGFKLWREALIQKRNLDPAKVHLLNYVSLANEVTIRDIAEGFDRALAKEAGLATDEPFDAIVHSTGMLVIRAWLTRFASMKGRPNRLRHLVALAPATNGSPVAHKGRSWMGALLKGSKDFGPDFMEAGDEVLLALELASRFTWDLAERDMFGDGNTDRFKKGPDSPYVFTICGDSGLGEVADFFTGVVGTKIDGSDGVVRWAGATLNSRRLLFDYTERTEPSINTGAANGMITKVSEWSNQDNIVVLWPRLNHGTIMKPKSTDSIVSLVSEALDVKEDKDFNAWNEKATKAAKDARGSQEPPPSWQQFVIRVVDERGDGVNDWTIGLVVKMKNQFSYKAVNVDDLHPYEKDKSYRCLHLNLTEAGLDDKQVLENIEAFKMNLYMNTNSSYVVYVAQQLEGPASSENTITGMSELTVDLTKWLKPDNKEFVLTMPYTTTFVEFRVNRDLTVSGNQAKVCHLEPLEDKARQ